MYRCTVYSLNLSQNRFRRKESGLGRKVSDAALYGFNKPQDIEEMRPEKEPLVIEDDSIPPGDETTQDLFIFMLRQKLKVFQYSVCLFLFVGLTVRQSQFRTNSEHFKRPFNNFSLFSFSSALSYSLIQTLGA